MHVQVDLLARDPLGVLTVVEVKYEGLYQAILSKAQRRRLFRVCAILAQFEPVHLVFARVRPEGVILTPVDGLTP